MRKTMYKICPECGAHLDPGEKCDCGEEIMEKQTPPVAAAIVPKHEREV